MFPSRQMRFGVRVGPRPKRRPCNFKEPIWYRGQKIRAPFFWVLRGRWVCVVARPLFLGEDVPGFRLPCQYWIGMDGMFKGEILMGLRKPIAASKATPGPSRPEDVEGEVEFTTLFCYLCDDTWEDGQARQRSTLIVFSEEDAFKACLTDKDNDMTLWASSKTLSGLLGALEARLNDPEAEWRKRRPPMPSGKKRT